MTNHVPHRPAQTVAKVFLALTVLTWIQIAFGALVRSKQAGLSCPDWPMCNGAWIPNTHVPGVIFEFGHRALAGVVTLVYVLGAFLGLRDPQIRQKYRGLLMGAGVLLVVQALMGAATVLLVNRSEGVPRPQTWTVVIHLILGNTFAALSLLTALKLYAMSQPEPVPDLTPLRRSTPILARIWDACLLLQMIVGGAIAGSLQGMACSHFPQCYEGIWIPSGPDVNPWTHVQLLHRLNACVLFIVGWTLAYQLKLRGRLGLVARALAWLVLAQALLGAMNIWRGLSSHVTTAHSLVGALLFSTTAVLATELAAYKRNLRNAGK